MDASTTATLNAVTGLLDSAWPLRRDQIVAWLSQQGFRDVLILHSDESDHPEHQYVTPNPVMVSLWESRPWSVGWFVPYESPEVLYSAHQEFVSEFSHVVGEPHDITDTTAVWLARGFVVESYAHGAARDAAKPVQQLQVALAEQAATIEKMARQVSQTRPHPGDDSLSG